jgi:hypothetical protein
MPVITYNGMCHDVTVRGWNRSKRCILDIQFEKVVFVYHDVLVQKQMSNLLMLKLST